MSPRENDTVLKAVRRIPLEAFGHGDLTVFDDVLAPDFVDHSFPPDAPQNADGLRWVIGNLRTAMPDLEMTLDIELRDGDFVVHHTHGQALRPAPCSGIRQAAGAPCGPRRTSTGHAALWWSSAGAWSSSIRSGGRSA